MRRTKRTDEKRLLRIILAISINLIILTHPLLTQIPETASIRNLAMGGGANAMVNNVYAAYQNPAGLTGIDQSCLLQILNLNKRTNNNFLSQTLILKLESLPVLGATVNLMKNDAMKEPNLSYRAFAAVPLLYIFSAGITGEWYRKEQRISAGFIMNLPFEGFIHKISAGLYGWNISGRAIQRGGVRHDAAETVCLGSHLQLRPLPAVLYNLTFDYNTVEQYGHIGYQKSEKKAGIEQIIRFSRVELAWRAGVSFRENTQTGVSAGAGLILDYIGFDAVCMKTEKDLNYMLSMSYKLGSRHIREVKTKQTPAQKVSAEVKENEKTVMTDETNRGCCLTVREDEISDKTYLLISSDHSTNIRCWQIHLINLETRSIIKKYGDAGDPCPGFLLDNEVLTPGEYRIALFYEKKDGKSGQARVDFIKN